jgi:hypothetical protein
MNKAIVLGDKYEFQQIVAFIQSHLNDVIGEDATNSLIKAYYDPGTPVELWGLEAVAGALCWAKEMDFTPLQRAELCSLLWNERTTPNFCDIEFEVVTLRDRLEDAERVWDDFTELLDHRVM